MSAKELTEWIAYDEYIEHIGGRFFNRQMAASRLQQYGGEEKVEISDFEMFKYTLKTPKQEAKEERQQAQAQAKAQAEQFKIALARLKQQ